MYSITIPYKNYKGKPRNKTVYFNLEIREIIKLMVPLNAIFSWRDSLINEEERQLTPEETVEFFNNFEDIILSAWGELDEEGDKFSKTGRYDFEEDKLFSACMDFFISDINEVNKLLNGIMPEGMEDLVRKQADSLKKLSEDPANSKDEDLLRKIAELQAQLPQSEGPDESSS